MAFLDAVYIVPVQFGKIFPKTAYPDLFELFRILQPDVVTVRKPGKNGRGKVRLKVQKSKKKLFSVPSINKNSCPVYIS